MERRVVNGSNSFSGGVIAEGEEVREIILAECAVVGSETRDTFEPFFWCFCGGGERGESLYAFAMFAPRLEGLFLLLCCCHFMPICSVMYIS